MISALPADALTVSAAAASVVLASAVTSTAARPLGDVRKRREPMVHVTSATGMLMEVEKASWHSVSVGAGSMEYVTATVKIGGSIVVEASDGRPNNSMICSVDKEAALAVPMPIEIAAVTFTASVGAGVGGGVGVGAHVSPAAVGGVVGGGVSGSVCACVGGLVSGAGVGG